MSVRRRLIGLRDVLTGAGRQAAAHERQLLATGRLLSQSSRARGRLAALSEVEFSVFSQFGDDGIIQWLIEHLDLPSKTFIEFGVENYRESNTRFLMMNDNWSGLVMDGSASSVEEIRRADYYWRHELEAVCAFVDQSNINALLSASAMPRDVGLLHIDLDGNDYWIWKAIDVVDPAIVILEYNSIFGLERAITVPYDPHFVRSVAHPSHLYFGASLRAIYQLSKARGYAFVGCNSAGNNAYFVRHDKLNDVVREVALEDGYVCSKYRESRGSDGELSFLTGGQRLAVLQGQPVFNVITEQVEPL